MSQKPAPQRPVRSRVSSGIPWWLWGLLIVVGVGTGIPLVMKLVPEDPEQLFLDSLAAAENRNATLFRQNIAKLKQFPNYSRQQKLLEGIALLGGARPLLAVPPLTEAAGEENDANKQVRSTALRYLGTAYAVADQRQTALQVFETMLKEDENSNIARQNIASILLDLLAWEEALRHLDFLADKKFDLSQVLNMRGDIRMELKQYKEAAEDFEASIEANAADPTNSTKSTKRVVCLMKIRDFEKADSIADRADQPTTRSTARAERLLEKEDLKGALAAMEALRLETPNSPESALTYGRIMLKYNTPEKAQEGLVTLRDSFRMSTRDVEVYRLMVDLAKVANDTELAGLAQQNVELLDAMNKQFEQDLANVITTRDDPEPRIQLAELAKNIGRKEMAFRIYDGLSRYYPDREPEFTPKKMALLEVLPQLVSTGVSSVPESAPATNGTSDE